MSGYRDDLEALRQKLAQLESELAEAKAGGDREDVRAQFLALASRVEAATEKLDEDRKMLAEIGEMIGRIRGEREAEKKEEAAAEAPATPQDNRKAWLLVGAVVLGVGASVGVGAAFAPPGEPPQMRTSIVDLPGAPHAIVPMTVYQRAKGMVGAEDRLESIEIRYISPDGHVDLAAPGYGGSIEFAFVSPRPMDPPVDPNLPLGAPRPTAMGRTEQRVTVSREGILLQPAYIGVGGDDIPEPHCAIEDVLRAANAPEGSVGTLTYKRGMVTVPRTMRISQKPIWEYRVEGTSIDVKVLESTCERER